MKARKIFKRVCYGFTAAAVVFIAATKGFNASTWQSMDWFELFTLSLTMAVNLTNTIMAYFDNDGVAEKIQ
jgi:hypothetical protein